MKTEIEVTQECIDTGICRKTDFCPITLAVKNVVSADIVRTGNRHIFIEGPKGVERLPLPDEAKTFVDNFDRRKSVKPFSFVLDIPEKYLKQ